MVKIPLMGKPGVTAKCGVFETCMEEFKAGFGKKGIETLVEAMEEVQHSRLVIAGTRPLEEEITEKIRS